MKKSIVFVSVLLIISIAVLASLIYYNKDTLIASIDAKKDENSNNEEVVKEISEEEKYLALGKEKLETLTLDEKIGQLLLVRYSDDSTAAQVAKEKCLGGYVLFEKDFKNKTVQQVQNMISNVQNEVKIPMIMAVDEEGGTVVRISSNSNLSQSKFKSSRQLYKEGGFELIKEDTINKGKLLSNLGINLNLAPVVDVSTNSSDYMYKRTLGEGVELTSQYAKTVIEASKESGISYTLKHFPGYGNNNDTHKTSSKDTRSYDEIINTAIPPFKAGIEAGAEAVLISHNIIQCIDEENPASISKSVHDILRNDLEFKGVIITDDLAMNAVSGIKDVNVKAILAGNNMIITSDYETSITSIKNAVINGTITEEQIDNLVVRNLAWKYYKNQLQ